VNFDTIEPCLLGKRCALAEVIDDARDLVRLKCARHFMGCVAPLAIASLLRWDCDRRRPLNPDATYADYWAEEQGAEGYTTFPAYTPKE
jgi:hypothetical protein